MKGGATNNTRRSRIVEINLFKKIGMAVDEDREIRSVGVENKKRRREQFYMKG